VSASEETLALLRRIAASNDAILAALQSGASGGAGAVASDRDLDGKYGDPEVRMRVKDWSGPDMKGRKYSKCPAEFLELLAGTLEWAAGKADENHEKTDSGKPVSQYRRADAARARGWAARIRAGKVKQETAKDDDGDEWGQDSAEAPRW
jgi:hypothetical protein